MKALVFLCAILTCAKALAQVETGSGKAGKDAISYIGSSEAKGSSDAVIVDEVPLAHTMQFLPTDNNGNIVGKNDLAKQVDQVFVKLALALEPARASVDNIIKLNVFLKSADLISQVQSLISRKFGAGKKPSLTYVAGDLTHPDALISIDAIAVSRLTSVEKVQFPGTPNSNRRASVAVLPQGPVVYVSGQAAKGGLAEAARGTLKQLQETLIYLGLNKKDIVQIKSFLTPMSSLSIVQDEFAEFFKGETIPPLVFVDWISSDPVIEIELIAASPVRSETQIEYITPPGMTASPVYSKVAKLNQGKKVYVSGIYGQRSATTDAELTGIFNSMASVLRATGSDFNHLLKATYYIGNDQYSKSLGDLRPKYYDPLRPPAASKAMVRGVGANQTGISIDMIGTIPLK